MSIRLQTGIKKDGRKYYGIVYLIHGEQIAGMEICEHHRLKQIEAKNDAEELLKRISDRFEENRKNALRLTS